MISTSTLKICLGATVAIGLISIGNYILNEKTEFQPTEHSTLVVNTVENERSVGNSAQTEMLLMEPIFMDWDEPLPQPEIVEVVAEYPSVTVIGDNIRTIRDCRWYCHGGCGITSCYVQNIIEQPIEEEDESLLSEQIFVDPYEFEAKTYPNPTRDNATIELNIEVGDHFTIQLFDLNGRLIQQIYDGELESGRQSFSVDLYENMPGLYFITIQSLFQQETLKIQKI